MLDTYEQHARTKRITLFIALVVIAGSVVIADHVRSGSDATTASTVQGTSSANQVSDTGTTSTGTGTSDTTTVTSTSGTASSATATYKDGSYTATSSYYVPHGDESIAVDLTLSNGVITAASIQNSEGDRDSIRYQEDFAAAFKSYVVGQKIAGLQLGIVAGASDTTQGFNDALNQIATKAQA